MGFCGVGLVVEHVLAKDETGVRFSYAAQRMSLSFIKTFTHNVLIEYVDNLVGNVDKGQCQGLSFIEVFVQNSLINKGFLLKDSKN